MGEADKVDLEDLRAAFEAIGKRDWDRALVVLHPDAVWYDPVEVPDSGVHTGHEEIRRFWEEELFEAWEEWHTDLHELIPSGDKILAVVDLVGTARHSGIQLELDLFQVFTFKDGLAVEQQGFLNREQAFEAAGINPRPEVEPQT